MANGLVRDSSEATLEGRNGVTMQQSLPASYAEAATHPRQLNLQQLLINV